jgi:hypothetical protein
MTRAIGRRVVAEWSPICRRIGEASLQRRVKAT